MITGQLGGRSSLRENRSIAVCASSVLQQSLGVSLLLGKPAKFWVPDLLQTALFPQWSVANRKEMVMLMVLWWLDGSAN